MAWSPRSDGLGLRQSVRRQHRHPLAPHAESAGLGALQNGLEVEVYGSGNGLGFGVLAQDIC